MVKLINSFKKLINFNSVIMTSMIMAYPFTFTYANNHIYTNKSKNQEVNNAKRQNVNSNNVVSSNNSYKGIRYVSDNESFALQIKGALKLDQRLFFGKTYNIFHSGGLIREFSLNFDTTFNNDLSAILGLSFDAIKSQVNIDDAYITYSGFKWFGENFRISIGKVNPSFCLENHSSSKWIPFLEKSSVTIAFRPDPGLGISVNKWQSNYSINASITQPKPNSSFFDENGTKVERSDRWQYNGRVTRAYLWQPNKLIQVGIFGNYNHDKGLGIEFSASPELKTRHSTNQLLNTTKDTPNKINSRIKSKNHYTLGGELLWQNGPCSFDLEYQFTKVNRDRVQAPGKLKFKGYRSNVNYVLTGESRIFKSSDGTLGQVIPESPSGAWEISGRYDYLNLNDKDIIGGSAHHIGIGATWYMNYNFSTTIEYIRSKINRSKTLERVNVNTVGARLQLIF